MQQTLLTKVEQIEQEAQALIQQARDRASKEMTELASNIKASRASIEAKAEETSRSILAEQKTFAEQEAHKTIQQSRNVVEHIHETAQKNRPLALQKAKELFAAEYESEL